MIILRHLPLLLFPALAVIVGGITWVWLGERRGRDEPR